MLTDYQITCFDAADVPTISRLRVYRFIALHSSKAILNELSDPISALLAHQIPHQNTMTKRKRTPAPSPPPPNRVGFEIPESLLKLKAITRELARQSELFEKFGDIPADQQLRDIRQAATEGPRFEPQLFQADALRFPTYSNKPFVPSHSWADAAPAPAPPNEGSSNAHDPSLLPMSLDEPPTPDDDLQRGLSADPDGPDGQLFEELNNALGAETGDAPHDPNEALYLSGGRMGFDNGGASSWNAPLTYNPNLPTYPPLDSLSAPQFSTNLAHHPSHLSSHAHPHAANQSHHSHNHHHASHPLLAPAPPTYYPKTAHPHSSNAQSGLSSKNMMPGYFKSNLRAWPGPGDVHNNPLTGFSHDPYAQLPAFGGSGGVPGSSSSSAYPPPPQPLASSPMTAFTEFTNKRH